MTRAKDLLFFSAADYYGEGKREKRLSPFIFEALGDKAVGAELSTANHEQLTFLDYVSAPEPLAVSAKRPQLHIDYLSYSQIETFRTCPLHYKLKYIFKVPTAPSASLSFGSSMHATLKNFYLSIKSGSKPTEKLLFKLLEENWMREGFTSKSHEKEFFEKGKLYLTGFLKQGFDPGNLPEFLEEPFTIPLNSKGTPLRIGGKIDRVDVFSDGTIEIVDYKTGARIPSQSEVDGNLQLSFYALAGSLIPNEPFGKKPRKIKLSLYYLDQQEKISTTRTKEQLEKAIEEIFGVREEIEKSDFKCSGNMLCQNCEYKLLCRAENVY